MTDMDDSFFEEDSIDIDRVAKDKFQVTDELLCVICKCLLWKPKSCGSCQQLFCNKCIRTWLSINPNSCPFRCSSYEEKRAPPSVCSMLSRLSIRCRNNSLGCTSILRYDLLEKHETAHCQFRTRQCSICGEFTSTIKFDECHKSCQESTLTCHLCNFPVNRESLKRHAEKCFLGRIQVLCDKNILRKNNSQRSPTISREQNYVNAFTRWQNRTRRFLIHQRKVYLVGFDAAKQARNENCWIRILTVLQLITSNLLHADQITFCLMSFGMGSIICSIIRLWLSLKCRFLEHTNRSSILAIIVVGLLGPTIRILLTFISDTYVILFIYLIILLLAAADKSMPMDSVRVKQSHSVLFILHLIFILVIELFLLILRVYFLSMPIYASSTCLVLSTILLISYIRYSVSSE